MAAMTATHDPFASNVELPLSPAEPSYVEADEEDTSRPKQQAPAEAKPSTQYNPSTLSGNLGSAPRGGQARNFGPSTATFAGTRAETRYTGVDTLDEPLTETIRRDVRAIYSKTVLVLWPSQHANAVLRDWDLWGPLVFVLTLAILLSFNASPEQALPIFTSVFSIVWLGSIVVTMNAKLLGGKLSFFQSLSALGYCLAPIVAASLVSVFVRSIIVRVPVCLGSFVWSLWAATKFVGSSSLQQDRVLLAVYPLFLFYFILSWYTLVQK